jgi:tetratricopeptide (TPR) repeat protein
MNKFEWNGIWPRHLDRGPQFHRPRIVFWVANVALLITLCCAPVWSQVASQPNGTIDELGGHIASLIEQLSDPNYSRRLRAQAELERIGVLALDQLHAASFHPDPQIASTARYVVQSHQFSWSWDTDPVSVRQILTNYGTADSDKSVFIDQLQRLEHDEGFGALCRLVRYETKSGLAKRAALLLMRSKPLIGQTLGLRKESLRNFVSGGKSQASKWVMKYSENASFDDLPWWEQILDDELQLLKSGSVDTNVELVIDLHRWVVEQIYDQPKLRANAISIGRSILSIAKTVPTLESMLGNRSTRANEFAQWALKYRLPELVQEQHAKLPASISSNEFIFGYFLAESFLLLDNKELANQIADLSLKQVPCDETGKRRTAIATDPQPDKPAFDFFANRNLSGQERHYSLGQKLQERGQFTWAEAEYRLVVNDDLTNRSTLLGMMLLSEMLHTQGKHADAAAVLEPFVARYKSEPMFARQMNEGFGTHAQILSYYHLYVAEEARLATEFEKATENYWLSIELFPEKSIYLNVDAMIGLYKIPQSEKDKEKRRTKLAKIVLEFRNEIRDGEELMKRSKPSDFASFLDTLANTCNTLAWVIVNTEGSKEEALFLSRKACSLAPEHAEYLDTLAYCYAAMGRYQDAVQQQRHAVELKPHHPELVKALSRFEAKLRSSK